MMFTVTNTEVYVWMAILRVVGTEFLRLPESAQDFEERFLYTKAGYSLASYNSNVIDTVTRLCVSVRVKHSSLVTST